MFPALQMKENVVASCVEVVTKRFSAEQLTSLQCCYDELSKKTGGDPLVFLLKGELLETYHQVCPKN